MEIGKKRETELEQIPLTYFETRDWMAADTKQLSPLHQVPHSFSTGNFQASLRCHANQDKLSLRDMYDKCAVKYKNDTAQCPDTLAFFFSTP